MTFRWNRSSSAPADSIQSLDAGSGLTAFSYAASGRSYALVHNPTNAPLKAFFTVPGRHAKYSLHLGTDGSVDRDKYLNWNDWNEKKAVPSGNTAIPLSSGDVSFTIPPRRNILVIGSNFAADHADGMKHYEDVFVTPKVKVPGDH